MPPSIRNMLDALRPGSKGGPRGASAENRPAPDRLTYVVGDIHGRADLLDRLLALIEADRAARPADLVFVGDYIDRGADSAGVIRRLMALEQDGGSATIICLRGNHEQMLLDFAHSGDATAARHWLGNGGDATAESFGVAPDAFQDPAELAAALRDGMAPGMLDWIAARPLIWQSGTLAVVHGAMDPALPPEAQTAESMLWGRPRKHRPRPDGLWVAHGHTVTRPAFCEPGRIAVDTGAWFTEILTAAAVTPEGTVRFVATADAREPG